MLSIVLRALTRLFTILTHSLWGSGVPPRWNNEGFDKGEFGSLTADSIPPGGLKSAVGGWYRDDDPKGLHKIRGRTLRHDLGEAAPVKDLFIEQYDDGSSCISARCNNKFYTGSTPASIKTLTADSVLRGTHFNDRHYFVHGDAPGTVKTSVSDYREHGIKPPEGSVGFPTLSSVSPITDRPSTVTQIQPTVLYPDNSKDTDPNTYSTLLVPTSYSNITEAKWSGFPARTPTDPWAMVMDWLSPSGDAISLLFEKSTNSGSNWNAIKVVPGSLIKQSTEIAFDPTDDPTLCQIKVTVQWKGGIKPIYGLPGFPAAFIYDVRAEYGSREAPAALTEEEAIIYAFGLYDSVNGRLSVVAQEVKVFSVTPFNKVEFDLSELSVPTGTTADNYAIYRTIPGGTSPYNLGLVDYIPVTETEWTDEFEKPRDLPCEPLYDVVEVTEPNGGSIALHMNKVPPSMTDIEQFKGSLVGVNGRSMPYSVPGGPEQWPALYTIDKWPLPENDTLVCLTATSSMIIIGAKGAIMRVESLPTIELGSFVPGQGDAIRGAPGVVGRKAMTAFGVSSETFVAWISPFGIYATNGFTFHKISDNIDWSQFAGENMEEWSLEWDKDRKVLIFCYTVSGAWRYALLHMHPVHSVGSVPKVTSGHYGTLYSLDSATVSSARLLVSGSDDGKVYNEDVGYTDASNAYDAYGTVPTRLRGRKMRADGSRVSVLKGQIQLGGSDVPHDIEIFWYYSSDAKKTTRSKTISLYQANGTTQFTIGRSADEHEYLIVHEGAEEVRFNELQIYSTLTGSQGPVV